MISRQNPPNSYYCAEQRLALNERGLLSCDLSCLFYRCSLVLRVALYLLAWSARMLAVRLTASSLSLSSSCRCCSAACFRAVASSCNGPTSFEAL